MKQIIILFLAVLYVNCQLYKIKNEVFDELKKDNKADIMIMLKEQIDFNLVKDTTGKSVFDMDEIPRGRLVMNLLMSQAERTQKNIINILKTNNIRHEGFWVSNSIAAYDVSEKLINELSFISNIDSISVNHKYVNDLDKFENFVEHKEEKQVEWNVRYTKTDQLWAKGFEGKDIIVGITDTGVEHNHPALVTNYRGNNGNGTFTHDFNWFDAQTGRKVPFDDNNHGTHCTGTVAGGVARKIGHSHKSKWIHCKALPGGTDASYTKCQQFFLAPFDLEGKNPNPDIRPHITSHSYGCVRCSGTEVMKPGAEALRAAGVMMVVAAGNSGSRCSSIDTQPGHYEAVVSVGALNYNSETITSFSSRGPITIDRSNRRKPDISAPGSSVTSSVRGGRYASMSGTSMAAPGVAGAIAVLWSAKPSLRRKIDETLKIVYNTANKQTSSLCSSTGSPNNVYGYGTINVLKAFEEATKLGY